MTDTSDQRLVELIQKYNDLFDDMLQQRHEVVGREKYGNFAFLKNDVGRMLMEELADSANYARYLFIKIGILNEHLAGELQGEADKDGNITIGVKGFQGTKEGWSKQE